MSIEHVRGLRIRDLSVRWSVAEVEPKWQGAVGLRRVTDFTLEGFAGRQGLAATETAAIVLDQSADGTIVNARGAAGCRRLVHVKGDATRDISVRDSRVPAGASVATFENDRVRRAVRVS